MYGHLSSDHHRLASYTSNDIDVEQVPGSFSTLTISSPSPQASAQNEKRFLALFFGFDWGKANVAISLTAVSFMMSACMHVIHNEYSTTVGAKEHAVVNYASDELLVKFRHATDPSRIKALNELFQVQVVKTLAGGQVNLVKVPMDKSLEEIRRAYSASPEVESVGLNYKAGAQQ